MTQSKASLEKARKAVKEVDRAVDKVNKVVKQHKTWIERFAGVVGVGTKSDGEEHLVLVLTDRVLLPKIQQLIQEKVRCRVCFEVQNGG